MSCIQTYSVHKSVFQLKKSKKKGEMWVFFSPFSYSSQLYKRNVILQNEIHNFYTKRLNFHVFLFCFIASEPFLSVLLWTTTQKKKSGLGVNESVYTWQCKMENKHKIPLAWKRNEKTCEKCLRHKLERSWWCLCAQFDWFYFVFIQQIDGVIWENKQTANAVNTDISRIS